MTDWPTRQLGESTLKTRQSPPVTLRGSAAVEYVVMTAIVLAALFLPMPLVGSSIVEFMLDALRGFQANTTVLLSLP